MKQPANNKDYYKRDSRSPKTGKYEYRAKVETIKIQMNKEDKRKFKEKKCDDNKS